MDTIKLKKDTWQFDQQKRIGDVSTFAEVFKGFSNDGEEVAIKRLNISATDTGNRELDISKLLIEKSFDNVIQIYDAGIDSTSDRYFIVMSIAEKSLAKQIKETVNNEIETIKILYQIVNGLLEVLGGQDFLDTKTGQFKVDSSYLNSLTSIVSSKLLKTQACSTSIIASFSFFKESFCII